MEIDDRNFEGTKAVAVNGRALAYREEGSGEPVVFVHGGLSDLRTWEQQLPVIGVSFRAVAYSRRYARPGEDIAPGVDDQMIPHVEDLAAFLQAIDASPAHLVGNSWGAFVCLLTAVRHPELVRSLVLEEPPVLPLFVSWPPRLPELIRLLLRRPRTAMAIAKFGATVVGPTEKAFRRGEDEEAMRTFARGVLGIEGFARVPESRRQQMRDNVNAARAQFLGAGFPPLRDDDVRSVSAPTLLVTGEFSPAILLRLTDRLEELLPQAERVQINGASHVMHEQNARALNDAVLGFITRASRESRGRPVHLT